MKTYLFLFAILFITACSADKTEQDNSLKELSYSKELVFDANHPDILIGSFSGLATDEKNHIYLADRKLNQIHKFSPDGEFLTSIGREGKGPGEFEALNGAIKVQGNKLYAFQGHTQKVDVFDTESNEHIRTISIEKTKVDGQPIGTPQGIFPLESGNIMVHFVDPYFFAPKKGEDQKMITVSEINPDGDFVNKKVMQFPTPFPSGKKLIYMEESSISVFSVEMYPDVMMTRKGNNVVVADSDSLLFTEYDHTGAIMTELKGSASRVPFTSTDLDTLSNRMGKKVRTAVNSVGAPGHWPAFDEFSVTTDGRYWIKQYKPWSDTQPWQIVNESGKAAYTVDLPADIKLYPTADGKAYAIHESENGLASVYLYTFEF